MAIEQAVVGESDGTQVYGLGEGPVVDVQIYQVPALTEGVVLTNPVLDEPVPAVEEPAIEEPVVEEPVVETPAAEETPVDPVAVEPVVEPVAEVPVDPADTTTTTE